jgi:hypothetical protein
VTRAARGDSISARCACGAVELAVNGPPIVSLACYCDTCQEGSRRIEALPDAAPVRDAYGGTEYTAYRKDRVAYVKGSDLVKDYALDEGSKTKRVVASCCNSAIMMRFDDARHWFPLYRARLGSSAPPVEMRICTRFLADGVVLPNDVPAHRDYPPAFVRKLLSSWVAMLLRR